MSDIFDFRRPNRFAYDPMDPASIEIGTQGFIEPKSVGSEQIDDGAIDDIVQFADTIRPPVVVGALPSLPNALYPAGSFVFLTTDKLLYKTETGATWVTVVDAGDLTGEITETQIADDSISTPKLKANSVSTAKLAAGAVTANEIAANTITAGQIAAAAIGADEIAANAVEADKIAAGAVTIGALSPMGVSNLLNNPSFEQDPSLTYGTVTGWTVIGGASTVQVAVPGSTPPHGKRVLSMIGNGANENGVRSAFIAVKPGSTYRLSGWAQDFANNPNAYLELRTYDQDQANEAIIAQGSGSPFRNFTGLTGTWTRFEDDYTVPASGVHYVRIYAYSAASDGSSDEWRLDMVEFIEVTEAVRNQGGSVTIDSSGITIKDSFGSVALTTLGFSESWEGFIHTGLYNGDFLVGDASTEELPYWEIGGVGSFVALDVQNQAAAPGGHAVRYSTTSTHSSANYASLQSDFTPVTGPAWYVLSSYWVSVVSGSGATVVVAIHWYTGAKSFISTDFTTFTGIATGFAAVTAALQAPTNARFAKIQFRIYNPVTASVAVDIYQASFTHFVTTQAFIPPGLIVMWSGETSAIPAGWLLCDGSGGTPDLRDRFIVGADSTNENTSGGTISPTAALTGHGTHTSQGAHDHGTGTITSGGPSATISVAAGATQAGIPTSTHTHDVTVVDDGGHTHDAHSAHPVYKFYRLAYIMKS